MIRIFKIKNISELNLSVVKTVVGNGVAQCIALLSSVILVRLYQKEDIGLFSTISGYVAVFSIVFNLRLDEAIVIQSKTREALKVFVSASYLGFLFTGLIFFLLFIFVIPWTQLEILVSHSESALILFCILFLVLHKNQSQIYVFWKKYTEIARLKVAQSSFTLIGQSIFFSFGLSGLLAGRLLGYMLSTLPAIKILNKWKKNVGSAQLIDTLKENKDFIQYNVPISFLNQLSGNIMVLLLPIFFGSTVVAYYAYSVRLVLVPLGVIISSLQQVYFKEMAEKMNNGEELYDFLLRTMKRLLLFGLLAHIGLWFSAESIFSLLLGDSWIVAGVYTKLLLPWLLMIFVTSPVSSVYIVTRRQKEYMFFESVLLLIRVVYIISSSLYFKEIEPVLIGFGLIGFMGNSYLVYWFLKISNRLEEVE